jgi:hypothetical protein
MDYSFWKVPANPVGTHPSGNAGLGVRKLEKWAIKSRLFSGENSGYPWVVVLADWENTSARTEGKLRKSKHVKTGCALRY